MLLSTRFDLLFKKLYMDEELLSFICSEYAKISGCSEVDEKTEIAYGSYGMLSQRIEKEYSCRMFRGAIPKTLWDLAELTKRNMNYSDFVVEEILNKAEEIVNVRYQKNDILFADLAPAQALMAKKELGKIMLKRCGIRSRNVMLKNAKTAVDWAVILCRKMNRFKN